MYQYFEDYENFICKIHNDQIPLFLEISDNGDSQMQCQVCIAKNSYKVRRLISIGQIFDTSKKTVINNWPPLEDDSLYDRVEALLNNKNEELVEVGEIKSYFEQIKKKLIQRIEEVQSIAIKKATEGASNNLISVYSQMSQKEEIKQCILDQQKFDTQMNKIIKESFKNKKQNTENLKKAIQNFGNRYQFDKKVIDQFFTFSLESLSDIEKIITQQLSKEDNQETFQKNEKKMVQFLDDLGSTIKADGDFPNQFSTRSMITIEDEIRRNLELFGKDSKSPSVRSLPDFDKISLPSSSSSLSYKALNQKNFKSNLQQRISLSICQRACKHSKAIQQNGFSFKNIDSRDTYNIGFIEASIDPNKNEFFSIHVKNLQNWIGIGVVEKEIISKESENKTSDSETISGYYMISHNGYFWQQKQQKTQNKNGQFVFKSDDIVTVSLIGNLLVFEKQNYRHKFEIQIPLSENTYLYPGFILYSQGDEIEFTHQ